jgi:hypothetical protein
MAHLVPLPEDSVSAASRPWEWPANQFMANPTEDGKGPKQPQRKATVAARMIDLIRRDPTTHTWTCRRFALKLNCKPSTVVATAAWKKLAVAREKVRLEREEQAYKKGLALKGDGRRRPKQKKRPYSFDD